MMTNSNHVWALVLAAGEGSRLRALTLRACGTSVPKQFCSLQGGRTLLEDAIARAAGLVAPERICTIVAQQHSEWWTQVLRHAPDENIIVQPRNRGTGIGILYSLLHIVARDPQARVVVLPADHYVREEFAIRQSLRIALNRLEQDDAAPVLLGLEPEEPDAELGYIVPGGRDPLGGSTVQRFVEKPERAVAGELIREGGLWNAFIIVASAQKMVDMFSQRFAPLVTEMQVILNRCKRGGLPGAGWSNIVDMYERLPDLDFSRHLLEGQETLLRVVRVPCCGWSDLGTPRRVAETLRRLTTRDAAVQQRTEMDPSTHINLAARHAQFERRGSAAEMA